MKKISIGVLLAVFVMQVAANSSSESYQQLRDDMLKKQSESKQPPKFSAQDRKVMQDVMQEVMKEYPSPGLKVGHKAPKFTLVNAFGETVNLQNELKKGPVVLVFYRGAWCPFCNLHLHVLKQNVENFKKYNASLIAVTPQKPDASARQIEKKEYTFEVLSDLNDTVMKQYKLYYELSPELVTLYKSKGLDVEQYNGKGRVALPVPGTFIIAEDGTIIGAHAEHDYKERMEPATILEILEKHRAR